MNKPGKFGSAAQYGNYSMLSNYHIRGKRDAAATRVHDS